LQRNLQQTNSLIDNVVWYSWPDGRRRFIRDPYALNAAGPYRTRKKLHAAAYL